MTMREGTGNNVQCPEAAKTEVTVLVASVWSLWCGQWESAQSSLQ